MTTLSSLDLVLRTQVLSRDTGGYSYWRTVERQVSWAPAETALVLCDVWDDHWCRGAVERLEAMLPRMDEVVCSAREAGVQIVHAPSETMDFYAASPARRRMEEVPAVEPPAPLERPDVPLPLDTSSGSSDTGETSWHKAWSRQHPAIEVDQERDGISDDGREVYSLLQHQGIGHMLLMGVHTNMCVLNRSFAIKQMVRWGVEVVLIRDLTDAMYDPASSPYVSHDEGTRLVVGYIEKFWCPTVDSRGLMSALGRLPKGE
jgi:nicotinamidase-related amidase